jgi:glycogen operon protein
MSDTSETKASALGITFEGEQGTIAVYSSSATKIELCILDDADFRQINCIVPLNLGDNDLWFASSSKIQPGIKYILRADGPDGPKHNFNPQINLIDPYAKAVHRENPREYYCVAIQDDFDWQGVPKPNTPLDETIIYEAHLRGLTRANQDIDDDIRGTYAALAHPTTIAHLKKIGITAVELLPIQMFISEPRLMNVGLINYWGYNTINFFTPQYRYASGAAQKAGPAAIVNELKTTIRELHRNGIEVLLDVVYNHTAEGGSGGNTFSYRGLDNAAYYRLDDEGRYQDTTGCGNSLNFANPHVVDLVLDSMRYWTNEMQIDGFRFDLATTLARDENNTFNSRHPMLERIQQDPTFTETKLIVEPWDVGHGGWQTGNFPDRFSEWNDRYRDSVRRFWLTDIAAARHSGNHWNGVADFATRLSGSQDVVDGPTGVLGSVNFVTAHDGFTLHDLVSYNEKHNQINGEGNRDGSNNNYSFNHGVEGHTEDATILATRRKAMRNILGTLLLSAGVPMITSGDERAKTQFGNNNAYCQDSDLSWVDWQNTRSEKELEETVGYLARLRRDNPALRPSNFGNYNLIHAESDRVRWYSMLGEIMTGDDWSNPEHRTVARFAEHLNPDGSTNRFLIVTHGKEVEAEFTLPKEIIKTRFDLLWNSALELPPSTFESYSAGSKVTVSATSILVFKAVDQD